MLITIITFIFSKLFSFIFFGQIWSENPKFLNLTGIFQRGTLLYAYYDFNVYFFRIFANHILWANLVPKSEVLQIDWNLVDGYITIYLFQFWCLFFSKFLSVMFLGKFCLKIWSLNWLKFGATLLYTCYNFNAFFQKFCHSYNFGKIWSQKLMLSQLTAI